MSLYQQSVNWQFVNFIYLEKRLMRRGSGLHKIAVMLRNRTMKVRDETNAFGIILLLKTFKLCNNKLIPNTRLI